MKVASRSGRSARSTSSSPSTTLACVTTLLQLPRLSRQTGQRDGWTGQSCNTAVCYKDVSIYNKPMCYNGGTCVGVWIDETADPINDAGTKAVIENIAEWLADESNA